MRQAGREEEAPSWVVLLFPFSYLQRETLISTLELICIMYVMRQTVFSVCTHNAHYVNKPLTTYGQALGCRVPRFSSPGSWCPKAEKCNSTNRVSHSLGLRLGVAFWLHNELHGPHDPVSANTRAVYDHLIVIIPRTRPFSSRSGSVGMIDNCMIIIHTRRCSHHLDVLNPSAFHNGNPSWTGVERWSAPTSSDSQGPRIRWR